MSKNNDRKSPTFSDPSVPQGNQPGMQTPRDSQNVDSSPDSGPLHQPDTAGELQYNVDGRNLSSSADPAPTPHTTSNTAAGQSSIADDGRTAGTHTTQPVPIPGHEGMALDRDNALEWFEHNIGKPKDKDLAEMLRWTNETIQQESVIEYQARWIQRAIPIVDKLDKVSSLHNPAKTKRTFLLLVAADYLHKPRYKVFERTDTAGRSTYDKWLSRPEIRAVYNELYKVMEEEVMEHELEAIRRSIRVTRISAARAAERRAELLEHANPWVSLQAARDILQSADRQTAAKGQENVNISMKATLSEQQVQQLLDRASEELHNWDSQYMTSDVMDGHAIIIENEVTDDDDKQQDSDGTTPPS